MRKGKIEKVKNKWCQGGLWDGGLVDEGSPAGIWARAWERKRVKARYVPRGKERVVKGEWKEKNVRDNARKLDLRVLPDHALVTIFLRIPVFLVRYLDDDAVMKWCSRHAVIVQTLLEAYEGEIAKDYPSKGARVRALMGVEAASVVEKGKKRVGEEVSEPILRMRVAIEAKKKELLKREFNIDEQRKAEGE